MSQGAGAFLRRVSFSLVFVCGCDASLLTTQGFIFLCSSNDFCRAQKRSTLKAEDVCQALRETGMADFAVAVQSALVEQRRVVSKKRRRPQAEDAVSAEILPIGD